MSEGELKNLMKETGDKTKEINTTIIPKYLEEEFKKGHIKKIRLESGNINLTIFEE
jgi:hypothetical protein